MAFLTPLLVNFWVEQQFEASKVWLVRTLVWGLAALWLGRWLSGFQPKPILPLIRRLLIALFLILCLSTFLSVNRSIALFGSLDRANGLLTQLSYFVLFGCIATQINPERSRRLLFVIILTAIPICLLGLAQAGGWQPLPVTTDARSPITTTLGRANFTGAYLALLLPLTLAAIQGATGRWQRMAYGTLFGLELIVIVFTQARAALIAGGVGVSLFLWLTYAPRWSRRGRWFSGLGGAAGLAGGLVLILQQGIASGGSIAARWTIWQASLRLLWPHLWLGYGADTLELTFPSVYPPQLVYYQGRGVVVDRAHNWLLDWSLNYGIVATLVFSAIVLLILRAGWQQVVAAQNGSGSSVQILEHPWLAACMAGVCAQLVGNLFLFEVAASAVLFWILLAIITATTSQGHPQPRSVSLPRWLRNAIMVIALTLVGGAVWLGSLLPLLADMHSWRGTQALGQGNPVLALQSYKTAIAYQPHRAAYHVAVALISAQLSRFEQAEQAMNQAIALRPTDPVPYTQLAAIYARQARESGESAPIGLAYAAYDRAIVLSPTRGLTYQQYADLALRAGDGDLAVTQAQRAVDLDATDGIAFGILGWAQLHSGQLAAAHSAFAQAVRWQPDSADFHLGLATVYFEQGDFPAASQAVARSLILDPTYGPALALQAQLREK